MRTRRSHHADLGKAIAKPMAFDVKDKGPLIGRSLDEALLDGTVPDVTHSVLSSTPAATGLQPLMNLQQVGNTKYFDAAGFPGRTVSLSTAPQPKP